MEGLEEPQNGEESYKMLPSEPDKAIAIRTLRSCDTGREMHKKRGMKVGTWLKGREVAGWEEERESVMVMEENVITVECIEKPSKS